MANVYWVMLKQKVSSKERYDGLNSSDRTKMIVRLRYIPDHFLLTLKLSGEALGYCHEHSIEFGALTPESKAAFVNRLTDRLDALAKKEGVSRDESFEEFYVCWALVQLGEVSDQIVSLLTARILQERYDGDQPSVDSRKELLMRCFYHYKDRGLEVPQEAVDLLHQRFDKYKNDSFEWGDQESYSHHAIICLLRLVLTQCPEDTEAWLDSSLKLFWSIPDGDDPYETDSDDQTEYTPEFALLEIERYLCTHMRSSLDYIKSHVRRLVDAGKSPELVGKIFECLFQAKKRQAMMSFGGGPHVEPVCAQREAKLLLTYLFQAHGAIFSQLIIPFYDQPYLEKHPAIIIAECDPLTLINQYFSQLAAGADDKAINCLIGVALLFKNHPERFDAIYIEDGIYVVANQSSGIPDVGMIDQFLSDFAKALLETASYTLERSSKVASSPPASVASVLSENGYYADGGADSDETEKMKNHS